MAVCDVITVMQVDVEFIGIHGDVLPDVNIKRRNKYISMCSYNIYSNVCVLGVFGMKKRFQNEFRDAFKS